MPTERAPSAGRPDATVRGFYEYSTRKSFEATTLTFSVRYQIRFTP